MSLARTATAALPGEAKQGQISSFHLHQVLIFQDRRTSRDRGTP